jgi:hypothetical protein
MENKKPLLMLDGKLYHCYEASELEDAKKRARKLADSGKQVTLKWVDSQEADRMVEKLNENIKTLKTLKLERKEARGRYNQDVRTWGQGNPGTLKAICHLDAKIENLTREIY